MQTSLLLPASKARAQTQNTRTAGTVVSPSQRLAGGGSVLGGSGGPEESMLSSHGLLLCRKGCLILAIRGSQTNELAGQGEFVCNLHESCRPTRTNIPHRLRSSAPRHGPTKGKFTKKNTHWGPPPREAQAMMQVTKPNPSSA